MGGEGQGSQVRALVLLPNNTYYDVKIYTNNLFDNDHKYSEKTYSFSEDLYVKQLLSGVNHISNSYTYSDSENNSLYHIDIIIQADKIEDVLDFNEELKAIMYHYQNLYSTTNIYIYASNDVNLGTKYHKALFFNIGPELLYDNIFKNISIDQQRIFLKVEDDDTSIDIENQLRDPLYVIVYR